MSEAQLLLGDCRAVLRSLPAESVHCVVTSPPYWGLRDYGVRGQIGLEATPEAWVEAMVEVFRDVKRVLRKDGTLWLNLGDSYAGSWGAQSRGEDHGSPVSKTQIKAAPKRTKTGSIPKSSALKPKDLIGQPWRVAFALQADGWYLRRDVIWAKGCSFGPYSGSVMPESARDRATTGHEYLFMLTKSETYFYDRVAASEPSIYGGDEIALGPKSLSRGQAAGANIAASGNGKAASVVVTARRNLRSVWLIPTRPYGGAHFATFPPDLVEPCVVASTSERGACASCGAPWVRVLSEATGGTVGRSWHDHSADEERGNFKTESSGGYVPAQPVGWKPGCACPPADPIPATVLDPFNGAGTTGLVALRLGRRYVGIELNPEYLEIARRRLSFDTPTAKVDAPDRAMPGDAERCPLFDGRVPA